MTMTTTSAYDDSPERDPQYERALELVRKQRSRKVTALSLLGAALLALFGAAYAAYSRSLANTPPVRMGTSY